VKPEQNERTEQPVESEFTAPPGEAVETSEHEETLLPENLTEEVVERTAGPVAQALDHDAVRWMHQNDLAMALEKPHRSLTKRLQQKPRTAFMIAGGVILLLLSLLVPVAEPHVSLAGESIGPAWLTNSLLTTFILDIVIILIAFFATRNISLVPGGLQNVMEIVIEYILDLAELIAGNRARTYFPWAMTIFIFVIISNWSGLIPGVGSIGFYFEEHSEEGEEAAAIQVEADRAAQSEITYGNELASVDFSVLPAANAREEGAEVKAEEEHKKFIPLFRAPSADLNMTFALAIVTMVMVQVFGVRALGPSYFGKFFVWSGPNIGFKLINGFVGLLELFSEFSRLIAFGFRLFGNIFAGEIVLATMAFLIAFLIPVPFYALEIFIGFVQALVFTMLALAFFSLATIGHGEHEH